MGLGPADILVLLLVLVFGAVIAREVSSQERSRVLGPAIEDGPGDEPPRLDKHYVVSALRKSDPTFTWDAFRGRVTAAYEVVQRARMTRRTDLAKRFGTSEFLAALEDVLQAAEEHDVPAIAVAVALESITPENLISVGDHHRLSVRIVGATTLAGAQAVENSRNPLVTGLPRADGSIRIDESWTFERAIGARTTPPTRLEHCPHCGAPIVDGFAYNCSFCGEMLREAVDDWMLAEIEPTEPTMLAAFLRDGAIKPSPDPDSLPAQSDVGNVLPAESHAEA